VKDELSLSRKSNPSTLLSFARLLQAKKEPKGSAAFLLIGGWLGILTGLVAWYTDLAGLLTVGKGLFHLPL